MLSYNYSYLISKINDMNYLTTDKLVIVGAAGMIGSDSNNDGADPKYLPV